MSPFLGITSGAIVGGIALAMGVPALVSLGLAFVAYGTQRVGMAVIAILK